MTVPEQTARHDWPYQRTFDAIAAAVSPSPIGGGGVAISVERFAKEFGPFAALPSLVGVMRREEIEVLIREGEVVKRTQHSNPGYAGTADKACAFVDKALASLPAQSGSGVREEVARALTLLDETIGFAKANAKADPDKRFSAWPAHARNCQKARDAVAALPQHAGQAQEGC